MKEGEAELARIYTRFAENEAAGRSALYFEIGRAIAADEKILARLVTLPREKRQPNLLLAAAKYLFGVVNDWANFRTLLEKNWDEIASIIVKHRTQTNEPARCAVLLPLFASLPQPLALLEVGASAGLCLIPDRYAFDYDGLHVAPSTGSPDAPTFSCSVNAQVPIPKRNVEIAWRAGLDLHPLDCRSSADTRWLEALVWPGEGERQSLLASALEVARSDPPRIVNGDLRNDLPALALQAPAHATLVVFHTAVLAYVDTANDRRNFADTVRDLGAQWISNESPGLCAASSDAVAPPGRFLMALNGRPVGWTDPHGKRLDWIS